jgi:hypothetical protein
MLQRHLLGTPAKFGVGANRAAVANHLIKKYGYIDICKNSLYEKQNLDRKDQNSHDSEKIGVIVLDDAMQVTQLYYFTICFLVTIRKTAFTQILIWSICYIHYHFVRATVLLLLVI